MPDARSAFSSLLLTAGLGLAAWGGTDFLRSWRSQQAERETWAEKRSSNQVEQYDPLAGTGAIARLVFPGIQEERFVISGATKHNLGLGPAWLEESSAPGNNGNCVIAGHRDTHFRILKDIRPGDPVVVEDRSAQHRYRVESVHIVEENDVRMLRPSQGAVLTLVTCYPFYFVGPAPRRFIVRAVLETTSRAKPAGRG